MKYWPGYVALGIVTFILVAGGVIGSRLSEQTLAFMAGVIFGGIAALPMGAIIGWAVRAPRTSDRAHSQPQPPAMIVTHPTYQSIPGSATYSATPQVMSAAPSARREFTTIGEEELSYYESESVW
jgi:hypothetical protein